MYIDSYRDVGEGTKRRSGQVADTTETSCPGHEVKAELGTRKTALYFAAL